MEIFWAHHELLSALVETILHVFTYEAHTRALKSFQEEIRLSGFLYTTTFIIFKRVKSILLNRTWTIEVKLYRLDEKVLISLILYFFYLIVLKNITNFNIYLLCMIEIKTTATHTRRLVVHILTTFCRFNEDYSLCYMSYLLAFKYIFSRQGNKLGISCLAY